MKKFRTILGLFLCFSFFYTVKAQENLIFNKIAQGKTQGLSFKDVPSILTLRDVEKSYSANFHSIDEVYFFEYSSPTLESLGKGITLTIPIKNKGIKLELLEVPESFYGYTVKTSEGLTLPSSRRFKHYRGIVSGDSNSIVAISFMDNEIMGIIATDEGNLNLVLDQNQIGIFFIMKII